MQVDPVAAQHALDVYQEFKFWLPLATAGGFLATVGGLLWKVFQGVNWLKGLKTDIATLKSGLESQLAQQTNAIVGELREMRTDIRLVLAPPPPRLARAKKKLAQRDDVVLD